MAVAKSAPKKTTAIVSYDAKFAKYAKQAAAATGTVSGNFIGTKGGILTVDKVPVPENTLECIALGHCFENALYDGDFDPDNPVPPICFAFGVVTDDMTPEEAAEVEENMHPHEDSAEPQDDGKGCKDCPANQWGSAEKGRGKACKNSRRIGVIAGDAAETGVADAKVHYLKVPPTSLEAWDAYVKQMADTLHRPPFVLVTSIKCVPPPAGKLGFRFDIKLKEKLEDTVDDPEVFDQLETRHLQVMKEIDFPYAPMSEEDRAPKKAAKPAKFVRASAKSAGKADVAKPAAKKFTRR